MTAIVALPRRSVVAVTGWGFPLTEPVRTTLAMPTPAADLTVIARLPAVDAVGVDVQVPVTVYGPAWSVTSFAIAA